MFRSICVFALAILLLPVNSISQDTIKWEKYRFEDPAFIARFPVPPAESTQQDSAGNMVRRELVSELEEMIFIVSIRTLDEPVAPESQHYYARMALEAFGADNQVEIVWRLAYTQNGVDGMQAEYLMHQGGFKICARFFVIGNQQFTYYVIVLNPDADLRLKDRFYKGFKLK